MSLKREKLRAGIALLEAAARLLEQAHTEFGGNADPLTSAGIPALSNQCRTFATRAVRDYDKAKP